MNAYPNDGNYPLPSFDQPVQSPDVDPNAGDLVSASFNAAWIPVLEGALSALMLPSTWEGTDSDKILAIQRAAILRELLSTAAPAEVPAPYWEDAISADDQMPEDTQIWYGYVSEGNFIEDAGVFLISNFLAATVSEKAAVLYATHQRKIRLAFLDGGEGNVVRVYANDILAAVVEMFGTGEVREIDVITGYVDDAVEILQVLDTVP